MDPQTAITFGVVTIFCTIATNRFLGERNYKRLSPDEKVKLVDQFSTQRSLATYIPLAIMGLVILFGRTNSDIFRWLFPVAVAAILVISIALQIIILQRLAILGLPNEFVSQFRVQSIAVQAGNVVALSLFAYGFAGVI